MKPRRICITGITVTGNKGGESMLRSVTHHLERLAGPCEFDLISVYPAQDRRGELPPGLNIIPGKPLTMLVLLPLSVLLWPFARLGPVRSVLRRIAVGRSLLDADLVVDCSGIAFVDGRGLPLLFYNMSLSLPASLLGKPVIKMAQAMGPFRRPLNRRFARFTLRRVTRVIARGDITGEYLADLGLTNWETCADTAFAMPVTAAAEQEASRYVDPSPTGKRRVGVSPSVVVEDYCRREGIDYAGILAKFIERLAREGHSVTVIPHSVRPGSKKRKNNDLLVCERIRSLIPEHHDVRLIRDDLNAMVLRSIIGRMDFFIASRFHSMVSALAMGVPTLLIGWSHKYREVMRMFDLEDRALGYQDVSLENLVAHFDRLLADEDEIRRRLDAHLPGVTAKSMRNFELAAEMLRSEPSRGEGVDLHAVIESGMCVACGACVAADPGLSLVFDPLSGLHQPSGPGNTAAASVCPAIAVDFEGLQTARFPGRKLGAHGVVDRVMLAQSANRDRNLNASSGGLIKELLLAYLAKDEVNGVICLHEVAGLKYEPRLLTDPSEVDKLPGSIYHNLPLDNALRLLRENNGRFVLVALPCQLEGLWTYIDKLEPKLADRIAATIGLVCGWNYSHHAIKALCAYRGIDFDAIEKISYRGGGPVGKLRISASGREHAISRRTDFSYQVAFDRSFNIRRCHLCVNHCNYLADIVVGDAWLPSTVGTKTGVSLVICRKEETTRRMRSLANSGIIVVADATEEEITESQSRRIAMGDFAYAYADYLRERGLPCPDMRGPNRPFAELAAQSEVDRFHGRLEKKRRLQQEGRYRRLWWRKATVELGPLVGRYVRWFLVRILKVKSIFGTRKEIAKQDLAEFR